MPGKRGRPITIQSNDPAIIRRREKTADRVRRYNERKRAERDHALTLATSQACSIEHNETSTFRGNESPSPVAHSQLSHVLESEHHETPQRWGASRWQPEQVNYTETSLERDSADLDPQDGSNGRCDAAVTIHPEDTTIRTFNVDQSPDLAERYSGPDTQACAAGAEVLICSQQEEVTNEVKQQLLLRRRQLAAARQRRYRDRQRILQGLPPRSREEDLQPGETVVDFTDCVDEEAPNMIHSQPDQHIPGIRRGLYRRPDRANEVQRPSSSTVRATNVQSCLYKPAIHTTIPPEITYAGADTEHLSARAALVEAVRERGQDETQRPHMNISRQEGEQVASMFPISAGTLSINRGETSALVHTARKLYDQLIYGFRGCSTEQHESRLQDHIEEAGDNHFGLDQIFNHPSSPSVLAPPVVTKEHPNGSQTLDGTQWNEFFCGVTSKGPQRISRVKNVCLHEEQTKPTRPDVSFDIDSFLGFATSLGVARNGLLYQPSPLATQNLSSDVHFGMEVPEIGTGARSTTRSSFNMLRDVPHFLLGRLVGAENVTLHVFLPHLEVSQGTSILSTAQLTRWNDSVLHPALYKHLPAHFTQHLPAGYQHALANSKARQIEARKIKTASYQSQQSISYCLPPEYLTRIWDDVQEIVAKTPGLHDFRDARIYLSAKGTKLQFKVTPPHSAMSDTIENFQAYLEQTLNLDHLECDQFFVDIGKEVCPPKSSLTSDDDAPHVEAQVYSWKRCCLEENLKQFYDGQPPSMGGPGQRYYEQNMLYEASSLTSETSKHSKLREGGLLYSQFYGSVKELSDASKCKPFDNDGIEELALDQQVRQGIRTAVGGSLREHAAMEKAYITSKRRADIALSSARQKSFGIREEHRISWNLFQAVRSSVSMNSEQTIAATLDCCPSYVWGVNTEVYLGFLRRSANKFTMGFETVLANVQKGYTSQEETKMMAMFLRCLKLVFGGHQLQRESALWWSRKDRHGKNGTVTWYGLGFSNTLPKHGYCWMEPRFDWDRLRFHPDVTDRVLFGNNILHNQQLRRGAEMQAFLNSVQRLEMAIGWLRQYSHVAEIQSRLISWIVHICLQQFRIDILHRVKGSIRQEAREEALKGRQPFCMEYLKGIFAEKIHVISGNRCEIKSVSTLAHLLFGFDDEFARTHWESLPFRSLCRRAVNGIQVRDSEIGGAKSIVWERLFRQRLWRRLLSYHWILPYPTRDNILQRNKRGERMWYSLISRKAEFGVDIHRAMQTRAGAKREGRTTGDGPERSGQGQEEYIGGYRWVWGRKMWQTGRPEEIPQWVWWTKEEWISWLKSKAT